MGKRNVDIHFRCTDSEYRSIRSKADKADVSVSEYLRRVAMGKRLRAVYDREAIGVLATITGDLARIDNLFRMAMTGFPDETGARARQLAEDAHGAMGDARALQIKLKHEIGLIK